MAVLNPLKLVIENFAEGEVENLSAPRHPKEDMGERRLPFTRELVIDAEDFSEDTSLSRKKFKRLVLGDYVRLRGAYVIKANRVEHDADGKPSTVFCELVENTVGENPPEGIKPRGVIHWVSLSEGRKATIRKYDRLFLSPSPDKGEEDFLTHINPTCKTVLEDCWIEPELADAAPESSFQFEREGYFVADRFDHSPENPVFNMTIGLRDNWSDKA